MANASYELEPSSTQGGHLKMSMQIPSNFDPLNSNGNHMSCFS